MSCLSWFLCRGKWHRLIFKKGWGIIVVIWIVPVPPIQEVFRTDPTVISRKPIFPIHSLDPCLPLSFVLGKTKKNKLIPFALAFPSYWLLHLNTQHVFTIITVYVVTWLPTRKRLCACADSCPAVTVKGFIDIACIILIFVIWTCNI